MQITYQKTRDNENDKTVWWTLTDSNGHAYEWQGDIPKDVDVQQHLDSNAGNYLKLIRSKEYPDSPLAASASLDQWEQWIADGCWVDEEIQAEKVEWTNKHPVETDVFDRCKPSVETITEFDDATTITQLKAIIKKLLIK